MKHYKAEDMKMPEMMFTFEGHDFILRCCVNVVDAVTELYDGNPTAMFSERTTKSVLAWLAAMMNDWAEDQEWPDYKPYTAKYLGRKLKSDPVFLKEIMELVTASISAPGTVTVVDPAPAENPAPAEDPEPEEK